MAKYVSEVTKGATWTETIRMASIFNPDDKAGSYESSFEVKRAAGQRFSHPTVKDLKNFLATMAAHGGEAIRVQ